MRGIRTTAWFLIKGGDLGCFEGCICLQGAHFLQSVFDSAVQHYRLTVSYAVSHSAIAEFLFYILLQIPNATQSG